MPDTQRPPGREIDNPSIRRLIPLALAVGGYWSPWLTRPAAALRLNGYELSEWVTFLPGVRDGSLPLGRLAFLLPLACLCLLLGLACALWRPPARPPAAPEGTGESRGQVRRRNAWLPTAGPGWLLLVLALLCAAAVFPPYPYILEAYRDPEFQLQFFLACGLLPTLALALALPAEIGDWLQAALALLAGGLAARALLVLHPAASALLASDWRIGLGAWATLAGCLWLVLSALTRQFGRKEPLP